jgi:glycosyltransferase involved in cell wall biosynthesis
VARFLLVSNDPVGRQMAGPGVRYFELARHLARRHEVTLVAPGEPDVEVEDVELVPAATLGRGRFVDFARTFDGLVAQQLTPRTMWTLAGGDLKIVYDLYDPVVIEALPLFADRPEGAARDLTFRAVSAAQLTALTAGDAFLCASERQRDLWIGALSALGRIDVASYAADPTLRDLVEIVPFGLDPEPPAAGGPALRGVVDGIGERDRILLWGGGIWSWFDPLTVIRAVDRLRSERDDLRLYFLGTVHPNVNVGRMRMAGRALELARELGLDGSSVFFNEGWVDYGERSRYLAESDLGVSAHFDNVETRFAFRTRLLDYFWSGLPTVATRGDVLGDMVGERRLGRSVGYGDVDGFASAIRTLLGDERAYREAQANLEEVRRELAWPVLAERLERLLLSPRAPRPSKRSALRTVGSSVLAVRASVAEDGASATARRVLDALRKPWVP